MSQKFSEKFNDWNYWKQLAKRVFIWCVIIQIATWAAVTYAPLTGFAGALSGFVDGLYIILIGASFALGLISACVWGMAKFFRFMFGENLDQT